MTRILIQLGCSLKAPRSFGRWSQVLTVLRVVSCAPSSCLFQNASVGIGVGQREAFARLAFPQEETAEAK